MELVAVPVPGLSSQPSATSSVAAGLSTAVSRQPEITVTQPGAGNSESVPIQTRLARVTADDIRLNCYHPKKSRSLPNEQIFKDELAQIVREGMNRTAADGPFADDSVTVSRGVSGKSIRVGRVSPGSNSGKVFTVTGAGYDAALKMQGADSDAMSQEKCEKATLESRNELKMFARIHNLKGVVSHYACGEVLGWSWILMEQASCDLHHRMKEADFLDQEQRLRAAAETIQGVESLHANNILHRDIKPENILCCDHGCKLSDFGLACEPDDYKRSRVVGTREFWSPECQVHNSLFNVDQQFWHKPADIWALGLTLGEISGLTSKEHALVWRRGGKFVYHGSMALFYHAYRDIKLGNISLEQAVEQTTGTSFDQFLEQNIPVPPYNQDVSWQIQLCIATLACIREKPELRPTATELRQWSAGFPDSPWLQNSKSPRASQSSCCVIC